ncbi:MULTISPECIES: c-type cytochrome biogenesis protein CcmI [unclassified Bradyrhizobium]|uniref:c-type cytochrome biogenesis protein CcmI n=1 Tax=unclassified Bradyrhizobium TaxID=2631580 RepID=UPI00104E9BBC|nr:MULTISPECIES: c-type cytochrome biogenesis protein CcmI [unclassified Bradyrhizobium]
MLIKIVIMLVTMAAGLILLYPLRRRPRSVDGSHNVELVVYHDQLKELERDRLTGLFSDEQAAYVRTEIAQRLLAAKESSRPCGHFSTSHPWTRASILVSLSAAFLLYSSIGRPDLPSHPFEHQAGTLGMDVTAVVANAKQVVTDGGDAPGRPLRPSPARIDGLAEELIAIAGGVVTEDARTILEQSLSVEPSNPRARFYIALSKEQAGRPDDARADFEALAKELPAGAEWLPLVNEHIARNGGTAIGPAPRPTTSVAPTAEDMAAADSMSSDDRRQFIRDMVQRLNAKLDQNPDDFEGWSRLVRSYAVLNDKHRAADALKRGLAAFPASGDESKQLQSLAEKLGIQTEGLTE